MSSAPDLPGDAVAADPLVGQLIEGRYRVLAPLGQGGMGRVYRVEHTMMKREMALKLLHPELGRSAELVKRFEREAEAAARLSHPNIITVTDFGRTDDGQLFLVMELLRGPSLADAIGHGDAARPLGVDRALHIVRQVLRALTHAHQQGVVHRDLKPDNIMLVEQDGVPDVVKLLDFGIARLTTDEKPEDVGLTQTGMIYGTPEYLSPEQAVGDVADGRADLYAVGVILYEMLAGHRPFRADSKLALVSMHVTQPALPVVEAAPDAGISEALSGVVQRALEKRREDRWQDAAHFLQALDGQGQVAAGRSDSLLARIRRRKNEVALIGAACSLLLVAAIATLRHGPAVAAAPLVDLSRAERTLKTGRSCKERKAAALDIIASGDRRHVGALEAARDRKGGFFGLEKVNACMKTELEAGIRKLAAMP